jgi:hypothetical protein
MQAFWRYTLASTAQTDAQLLLHHTTCAAQHMAAVDVDTFLKT